MPTAKRRAAEAAVEAGAFPQPKGRRPKDYPIWDGERGCWVNNAGKEQPSATVQPEQQPEPQPMMEQPPSQPRTQHAGLPALGRAIVAADMQQRGKTVSDAWAHAIIVTNMMFSSILPRVDDSDPKTHMSYAMEERLGMHGLKPSDRVLDETFWRTTCALVVGVTGPCDALVRSST